MIQITFSDTETGVEISAQGHAGYAETGQDIVCAGVSAITYTALGALSNIVGDTTFYMEPGNAKIVCPATRDALMLIKAIKLGYMQVAMSHPQYVEVQEKRKKFL